MNASSLALHNATQLLAMICDTFLQLASFALVTLPHRACSNVLVLHVMVMMLLLYHTLCAALAGSM